MTKIKAGLRWLRDVGQGTHEHPDMAHQYTDDEAWALTRLDDSYSVEGPMRPMLLEDKFEPAIPPGEGMVWVKYKSCWYAAERQALFMGTRKALQDASAQASLLADVVTEDMAHE